MKPLRDVGRNSIIILIVVITAAFLIAAASDLSDLESGGTLTYGWLNTLKDAVVTLETSWNSGIPTTIDLTNATNIPDITDIQNGTAPTADDPGEIAHDTTDDQLIYDDNVLSEDESGGMFIDGYAKADDNWHVFPGASYPVTITAVGARCWGTCTTTATITFEDYSGNAMTHAAITIAENAGDITFVPVTAGGSLSAGEGMQIDNTSTTQDPETDTYEIVYTYKRTRQ